MFHGQLYSFDDNLLTYFREYVHMRVIATLGATSLAVAVHLAIVLSVR